MADDAHVVDARNLACPLPIVRLAAAMRELPGGTQVQLWATDAGVEADVAAWCAMTGNQLLSIQKRGHLFWVDVQKAASS